MDTSLQLSLLIVLAVLCVLVAGNFMINRAQGMSANENWRETKMWGGGFIIYAALDYLILMI
jgi:hypothetical protein